MPVQQVEIIHRGIDWGIVAAFVQAFLAALAIYYSIRWGIRLQDRGRLKKEEDELRNQVVAVKAIGARCERSIRRLHDRAQKANFRPDVLGWLKDEAQAAEDAAASVDLMTLRAPELTEQVAELQEATRTARRRLGYNSKTIENNNQPDPNDFADPLKKAQAALNKIGAISPSKVLRA